MEDIHKIYSEFKKEFPEVHRHHEALGKKCMKRADLCLKKVAG
jgi:hypothetical protein